MQSFLFYKIISLVYYFIQSLRTKIYCHIKTKWENTHSKYINNNNNKEKVMKLVPLNKNYRHQQKWKRYDLAFTLKFMNCQIIISDMMEPASYLKLPWASRMGQTYQNNNLIAPPEAIRSKTFHLPKFSSILIKRWTSDKVLERCW